MPIDERSVEWLRLLAPATRFPVNSAPPGLREVLSGRLGPDPNAYFGWRVDRSQLPPAGQVEAMVLLNPSHIAVADLRALGFSHTVSFSVLPSLADPRVLAPLDNARVAARALDFITVYQPLARLARAATLQIARTGQLGRVGDRIVLARRADTRLEQWLRSATGLPTACLAISPGVASYKRKVTIQVMAPDGQVVAFAKVADSPAARRATELESARLLELASHQKLAGAIPRLIDRACVEDAFVTVISPGPSRLAPARFGSPHWDFLATLAEATGRTLPFGESTMWSTMHAGFELLESQLSLAWRSRLAATLARVRALLAETPLRMGVAHRDFQPANMRQFSNKRLFVYDWEGAEPTATPLYDFFNYNFLSTFARGTPGTDRLAFVLNLAHTWCPRVDERLLPVLFAAYVADHALRRLANSNLDRDRGSVVVLAAIAELLDRQGEWL